MRECGVLLLIGILTCVSPVAAGDGTLAKGPPREWAIPLSDAELEDIRGGIAGMAFGVYFTGFFDNLGNVTGNLMVDDGGATTRAPPPDIRIDQGQAMINTVIGDFNGASGIFQISQVPGSFNVVHNNLFVQIAIVNVMNGATVPSLPSLLRPLSQ